MTITENPLEALRDVDESVLRRLRAALAEKAAEAQLLDLAYRRIDSPIGPLLLVATERGSMAHRLDCVVVAGKSGLRPVTHDDGLAACKLCDPYAPAPVPA